MVIIEKCLDCGKVSDALMICTYPDGEEIKLCPTCIKKDGNFCLSCGNFCAGIESFDFSDMPGYCRDCVEEIESDFGEDEFEYCGDCNNPDACDDFGCLQRMDDEDDDPNDSRNL